MIFALRYSISSNIYGHYQIIDRKTGYVIADGFINRSDAENYLTPDAWNEVFNKDAI